MATALGSFTGLTAGSDIYFMVGDGTNSVVYRWTDTDGGGDVDSSELTLAIDLPNFNTANRGAFTADNLQMIQFGGASGDTLTGGARNEEINGRDGDDAITGGGGADTLTGGDGSDKFTYAAGSGA
ncbi:MAG: calcium-binding protein [Rhodospirillales bacterium]